MNSKNRPSLYVFAVALLLGVTAMQSLEPITGATAPGLACPPNWERVDSPNPRSSNRLDSVFALANDDVWAVGYKFDFASSPDHTLAMHWDGTAWTEIASPNPVSGSYLEDVTAFAPDDVWAVGYAYIGSANTLTIHWDGTDWTIVPSPNTYPSTNELHAVDGVAPDDIWAVGSAPAAHTLVTLHWDGEDWTGVPNIPNDFSSYYEIGDVEAIASDDVWVVGARYSDGIQRKNFVAHWNGTNWQRVTVPNQNLYFSDLTGIVAVSADEIYAVGSYTLDSGSTYLTQILKYNGTSWTLVPSPNGSDGGYNRLEDITVGADGDLWAVGYYHYDNFPTFPGTTLVLRYDGATWEVVNSPNGNYFNSNLYGVSASPQGDLWSVGRSYNDYNTPWETLIIRNDCPEVGATPTPAPTQTITASPSATLTPPATATTGATGTPVATTTSTSVPSVTASATATVISATATASASATTQPAPTHTPTVANRHLYLPLMLRDAVFD